MLKSTEDEIWNQNAIIEIGVIEINDQNITAAITIVTIDIRCSICPLLQ